MKNFHTCNFSGSAADLPRKDRTAEGVLQALNEDPKVSTWDMSEKAWVRNIIEKLILEGLVRSEKSDHPWHKYTVTKKGIEKLESIKKR